MYLGSLKLNDMLVIPCDTHNPTNGMAQTADAVPTYHIYKDNNPTPIMTGTLSLLNSPNAISHYTTRIMATGTIFAKNSNYDIYIRAVVAGYTGTMGHSFQIEAEVDSNTVSDTVGITTGTFLDALADKVWDEILSGHLAPGSAGHTLFSRMPTGTVLVGDKTGFYLATPQNFDMVGNISGTIINVINVLNPVGIVTGTFVEAIADQVWDEQISGHLGVGSTGKTLSDVPTANNNADALLKRDWTVITGESARSVLNALRFIRNKFSTTATPGSVTVYKEDDTTVAYTKTVTTDPAADPIVEG